MDKEVKGYFLKKGYTYVAIMNTNLSSFNIQLIFMEYAIHYEEIPN
ncbi:hypothetical protein [Flavobacterium sp. J27]|nr:hypothetical protein [Flavobacterium sp. J27]